MKKIDPWLAAQAHEAAVAGLKKRIKDLESALAEIYHSTSCTEGQFKLIESVLPQKTAWPECSGDPSCCPENAGYGCCKANPIDGSRAESWILWLEDPARSHNPNAEYLLAGLIRDQASEIERLRADLAECAIPKIVGYVDPSPGHPEIALDYEMPARPRPRYVLLKDKLAAALASESQKEAAQSRPTPS